MMPCARSSRRRRLTLPERRRASEAVVGGAYSRWRTSRLRKPAITNSPREMASSSGMDDGRHPHVDSIPQSQDASACGRLQAVGALL
jgi:hypothetical protein